MWPYLFAIMPPFALLLHPEVVIYVVLDIFSRCLEVNSAKGCHTASFYENINSKTRVLVLETTVIAMERSTVRWKATIKITPEFDSSALLLEDPGSNNQF